MTPPLAAPPAEEEEALSATQCLIPSESSTHAHIAPTHKLEVGGLVVVEDVLGAIVVGVVEWLAAVVVLSRLEAAER